MDNISERLREERERLGLTQDAFSALAGVSKPSQVRYESGGRDPDASYFAAISKGGADILYVLTGRRENEAMAALMEDVGEAAQARRIREEFGDAAMIRHFRAEIDATGDEYVAIPRYAALLAAGDGAENGADTIIDHLMFRRGWLRQIGLPPSRAALAKAAGDSMKPLINDGDDLLIDTGQADLPVRARPASDKRKAPIYALLDNGLARVKRLERPAADVVMLISDNPDFAPEVMTGARARDLRIIGRVRWFGHTVLDWA